MSLEDRVGELEFIVEILANYVNHMMFNQENGWKPRPGMTEKSTALEVRAMMLAQGLLVASDG